MKSTARLAAGFLLAGLLAVPAQAGGEVDADDVVFNEDGEVVAALTAEPGNAERGREWFQNRKLGNCLACHQNDELAEQPFHGEVGPELNGVADRYSTAALRGIVVNSKIALSEETMMPSFYRKKNGARPAKDFKDKSILTAQQVEDVVAYLLTLKE